MVSLLSDLGAIRREPSRRSRPSYGKGKGYGKGQSYGQRFQPYYQPVMSRPMPQFIPSPPPWEVPQQSCPPQWSTPMVMRPMPLTAFFISEPSSPYHPSDASKEGVISNGLPMHIESERVGDSASSSIDVQEMALPQPVCSRPINVVEAAMELPPLNVLTYWSPS